MAGAELQIFCMICWWNIVTTLKQLIKSIEKELLNKQAVLVPIKVCQLFQ